MEPEMKQLDLFSQEKPQPAPRNSETDEEARVPVGKVPPKAPWGELQPINCSRCGDWLCDALTGARAYCPRCRVWSGNC